MVLAFAGAAGLCVLLMMALTCADVVGRAAGRPLPGAYDLVKLLGAFAIAFGLPYTTAVKGHVAVEYFFGRLPRRGRVAVDAVNRLLVCGLLALLCRQSALYGISMRAGGEMMPTLPVPVFWAPFAIAVGCGLTALVVLHNLFHPGRTMIRP
jgi:TRAP-type C4-dicarboxylate transport system permease small subunit